MNSYDLIMTPVESNFLGEVRKACVSKARGRVLEIGIGTGANLPFYVRNQLTDFVAIDANVNKKIKKIAEGRFKLIEGNVENLPFANESFDTVVATLLLCSVSDINKAITEIKRVLKPGGKYIFLEHILPEKKKLANVFNKINPVWSKVAHGCNLNRNTDISILQNGFKILSMQKKWNTIGCFGIAEKLF